MYDVATLQQLRDSRWKPEKAWKWYEGIGAIRGFNYVPRTAVNSTEMWQKETFDPRTIDEELGWAERCGLNSARVFVQYIVYEADPQGLIGRMEHDDVTATHIAWESCANVPLMPSFVYADGLLFCVKEYIVHQTLCSLLIVAVPAVW